MQMYSISTIEFEKRVESEMSRIDFGVHTSDPVVIEARKSKYRYECHSRCIDELIGQISLEATDDHRPSTIESSYVGVTTESAMQHLIDNVHLYDIYALIILDVSPETVSTFFITSHVIYERRRPGPSYRRRPIMKEVPISELHLISSDGDQTPSTLQLPPSSIRFLGLYGRGSSQIFNDSSEYLEDIEVLRISDLGLSDAIIPQNMKNLKILEVKSKSPKRVLLDCSEMSMEYISSDIPVISSIFPLDLNTLRCPMICSKYMGDGLSRSSIMRNMIEIRCKTHQVRDDDIDLSMFPNATVIEFHAERYDSSGVYRMSSILPYLEELRLPNMNELDHLFEESCMPQLKILAICLSRPLIGNWIYRLPQLKRLELYEFSARGLSSLDIERFEKVPEFSLRPTFPPNIEDHYDIMIHPLIYNDDHYLYRYMNFLSDSF